MAVKEAVIVDDRQARRKKEKSESDASCEGDFGYRPSANHTQRSSYVKI